MCRVDYGLVNPGVSVLRIPKLPTLLKTYTFEPAKNAPARDIENAPAGGLSQVTKHYCCSNLSQVAVMCSTCS